MPWRRLREAGGSVSYDWEWTNGNYVPGGKVWAPNWLVDLLGVDYFGHVTRVGLLGINATNPVIAQVECLTQLEEVSLSISGISDTEMAHLKGLTNLSSLDLLWPG